MQESIKMLFDFGGTQTNPAGGNFARGVNFGCSFGTDHGTDHFDDLTTDTPVSMESGPVESPLSAASA